MSMIDQVQAQRAEFNHLLDQVVDVIRKEQGGPLEIVYHLKLRLRIETLFERSPAQTVRILRKTLQSAKGRMETNGL